MVVVVVVIVLGLRRQDVVAGQVMRPHHQVAHARIVGQRDGQVGKRPLALEDQADGLGVRGVFGESFRDRLLEFERAVELEQAQ